MDTASVRVLGAMLQSQEFNQSDICIWGYPQEISSNGREFKLKTTDNKQIPVVVNDPLSEYLENLIQIRGRFDGRKIQASSYSQFLPELTDDFDPESYNECVKLITNLRK